MKQTVAKIVDTNGSACKVHFYGKDSRDWLSKMLSSNSHPVDFLLSNNFETSDGVSFVYTY